MFWYKTEKTHENGQYGYDSWEVSNFVACIGLSASYAFYGPWFQRRDKQPRKDMYFGEHLTSVLSISFFRQRTMLTIMFLSNKSSEENVYRWFNLPCNTRILTKELLNDQINLEATCGIHKFQQSTASLSNNSKSIVVFFFTNDSVFKAIKICKFSFTALLANGTWNYESLSWESYELNSLKKKKNSKLNFIDLSKNFQFEQRWLFTSQTLNWSIETFLYYFFS